MQGKNKVNWLYNNQMQSSLCKRIARSFELQRYIPEYQVYELCINWQSEIPIPPTIFFLSEIFIYPYTIHQLPLPIKKELATTSNINKVLVQADTMIDNDTTTATNKLSKQSFFASFGHDHENKQTKARILDYDQILASKVLATEIKARNRQIVKHNDPKAPSDTKKKRKI